MQVNEGRGSDEVVAHSCQIWRPLRICSYSISDISHHESTYAHLITVVELLLERALKVSVR